MVIGSSVAQFRKVRLGSRDEEAHLDLVEQTRYKMSSKVRPVARANSTVSVTVAIRRINLRTTPHRVILYAASRTAAASGDGLQSIQIMHVAYCMGCRSKNLCYTIHPSDLQQCLITTMLSS